MAEIMISTENLTKYYGGKAVVDNVSLQVEKGSIAALVGQNGAGKTTLIRMLTGLVTPTGGKFELLGGEKRKNQDVAAIVERPSIHTGLTAMDNLTAQSILLGIPVNRDNLAELIRSVGLDPYMQKPAKSFSLGMKQRLAIAMTMVGNPKLLLLDEPTNGLDPRGIVDMRELFVRLSKEEGVTILISSHILSELGKFATHFFIMNNGKLIKQVSREELLKQAGNEMYLTVDNIIATVQALKDYGEAEAVATDKVRIKTTLPIGEIMAKLTAAKVTVTSFTQGGDPLEDYYMKVIRENGQGVIQ